MRAAVSSRAAIAAAGWMLLALLALLAAPTVLRAAGQSPTPPLTAGSFVLNVVYSIDIRGRMLPIDNYQTDCTPDDAINPNKTCSGGIARRYGFVQQQRAAHPNTIVMDVGNMYYGSSFMNIVNPAGSNIAKWISQSTPAPYYDVIGLGSNDFFNGPSTLAGFLKSLTGVQVVGTNLNTAYEPLLNDPAITIRPYSVHTLSGRKVGVLSVITAQLESSASAGEVFVWPSTIGSVNETLTQLKAQHPDCNIIVLMSNLRTHAENEAIGAAIPDIDVMIYRSMTDDEKIVYTTTSSSGSTMLWATMPNVGGASAFGGSMGALQIDFDDDGRIQSQQGGTFKLDSSFADDAAMWDQVKTAFAEVAALDNRVVANINRDYGEYQPRKAPDGSTDFTNWCRVYECNLGRLITDSMLHWCTDCHFAHANGGGLRTNIYRSSLVGNNVTRGVLSKLMPFGNNYVTYKIQGKDFQNAFLKVAATKATAGGFPQFSGLRWAWNPRYTTNETMTTSPNGITAYVSVRNPLTGEWATIDPQRVYKVATLNFMFTKGAGDGYVIGPTIAYDAFGPPDVDAVAAWMSSPRFVPPPSLTAMRACSNQSYVLADLAGDGNVAWPAPQCNIIRTSSTQDLGDKCPTNEAFCSIGEVYEGKFVNTSTCGSCSGLGTCVKGVRLCACDRPLTTGLFRDIDMVQGHDCSAIRQEYSYNGGLVGFLYGISSFTILLTFGVSAFFYVHRDAKVVKRSANMFLQIACLGALLAGVACISIITPTTDVSCQVSNWFGNMGFVLLFGSLFVKTWRIYAIFGNKRLKTVVLTDRDMLLRLGVFVAFELTLRFAELGATPIRMTARELGKGGSTATLLDLIEGRNTVPVDFYYYLTCRSPHYNIIDDINWAYKACFTLWGCGLAYSIKDIQEDFNESKLLALVIYNMTVFAVIAKVIILFVGATNPSATLVIEVLAINIVVLATLLGLSVPKWLVIRRGTPSASTQSQLSRGTGGTGGKQDQSARVGGGVSPTDEDQTINVTMGASGGRVNPAMFQKTCDAIRNRLRTSAQDRHNDLAPFLEHATRFVEQLQTLRGGAVAGSAMTPVAGRPGALSVNRALPSRGGGGGGGENRIDGANSSASGIRAGTSVGAPMSPSSISVELGPLALRSSSTTPLALPPLPLRNGGGAGAPSDSQRQPMVAGLRGRSSSRSDSPLGQPGSPDAHAHAHALSPNLVPDEQPEPPPEDEYEPSVSRNE